MQLVTILVSLIRAGVPLPDFSNEAAVKAWLDNLSPVLAAIIVRLISGGDAVAACEAAASDDGLWEAVAAELESGDDSPGRIGDGTILKWLKENGPALLNLIMTIIAFIPKTQPAPAPAPGPVT
jgi:hypothetical protein